MGSRTPFALRLHVCSGHVDPNGSELLKQVLNEPFSFGGTVPLLSALFLASEVPVLVLLVGTVY